MGHRPLASMAALAAVVVVALFAQAHVAGQVQTPATTVTGAAKAWTPPLTPDGKPDLQGIWNNATLTPLERPKGLGTKEFYTEKEFAELMARVRKGDVGPEGNLGAAESQPLRYDLSLYGFDLTKARFASNRRTSLIIWPEGVVPPTLP